MKMIFVAGPCRAASDWEIHQNIRRAETLSLELWRLGVAVLCPHKNTEYFGGAAPDEVWLDGALEMVKRSDAVICTPDWQQSEGARGEVALAHREGIPVFYNVPGLEEWLRSQE